MFWEQENLEGHKRNLGGTAPECPSVATGLRLRGRNMVNMNIHNPLTASLGWDKLSSDCKLF